MRKLLCSLTILALAFGAVEGFAAPKTLMKVPMTKGGSPVKSKLGKLQFDPHSLAAFKAQNHLSYAMNQKIQQAGGKAKKGSYINGTIDTIPYFSSWFITGSRNSIYPYSMAGQSPTAGGTTTIHNRDCSAGSRFCTTTDKKWRSSTPSDAMSHRLTRTRM